MKKHILFNFLFLFLFSASSFGSVKLVMGNYTAAPGTQVTVPVKVADFLDIVSAQGTIQFNQSIISYVSVQNFGLPGMSASSFGVSQVGSGKLSFSWFDGSLVGISLPDSATLFTIKFNVTGTAGQVSALTFANSPTPMEVNDNTFTTLPLSLHNGSVTVQNAAPSNNATLKIDTVSGTQGSQVLVSVRGVNFTNINSVQGTIQFNPSVATYAGIASYGLPGMGASNFGTSQIASGKLTFNWFDGTLAGQNVANNAALFTIKFNLTGSPGSQTIVNFTSSPTPLEVTDSLLNVVATNTVSGLLNITNTPSSQTLKLRPDTVSGPTGSQVIVPVRAWNFHRIMSAQGTISFNTAVATYAGTQQYGLPGMGASNFGTSQTGSGKLMFSWTDGTLSGQSLGDSSVVFAIAFNVVGFPGDITPVTFIDNPTPVEIIDSAFNVINAVLDTGRIRVSGTITLTTSTPATTVFCAGDAVSIDYSTTGNFNAANNFILQLSGPTGSFASPVNLDTIAGNALSGTFNAVIPLSTLTGTGYRFRVITTNPAVTGTNNGTDITINQIPATPGLPAGTTSLCTNPANTTYTISPVAGATSYSWTFVPAAAGTMTPSGTSAVVDWNNTYTGTAQLFVSAANGTCQSINSDTLDVTIYAMPATPAKPLGDSALCASSGTSVYTILPVSDATSYVWQLTPAAAGTITGTGTSATVTWNASFSGTASISVAGANPNCTGTYSPARTVTILLSPVTPVLLSGNTNLCMNPSDITYTLSSDPNATSYIWSLSNPATGVITPSGASASVNWDNAFIGSVYLRFTASNGTCSASDSVEVIINALPATPGAISGLTTLCSGTITTYSVTNDPAITNYTWTLPGGWSGMSTTNSISAGAGTSGGTISVVANNGCGTTTAQTLAVTVNNIPATPGTIAGTTTVCSGSSNIYSIVDVAGATDYTWTLPGGWTGTSTTDSITTTASVTSGNITVTANNTCGSSTAQTIAIVVNTIPASPGTIAGPASICEGNSAIYSIVDIPGATGYTWTLPSSWTGSSTTDSITVTAIDTGGVISVTANNSCGSSITQTFTVIVDTLPPAAGAIAGATTVCAGTANTYSIAPVPGANSYTWTLPGGWTGTSTADTILATAGASGGMISVIVNSGCGSSAAQTLAITVNTVPASPGTIVGTTTICSGSSNIYSIADVPNTTDYTWTLPGGWTGTSTTDSITTTASATSGTISVTANNSCGSSVAQTLAIIVNTVPASPVISGPASICEGNSAIYSVTDIPDATGYTWTIPSNWSGVITLDSIAVTPDSSGTISVTADNACGSSLTATFNVLLDTLPASPGAISGATTICEGATEIYSIAAVPGANSYTWTLPGGWTGSSTTDSITAIAGISGGTISVFVTNGCGNSAPQTLAVTVNTVPASPGPITGITTLCSGTSSTYSTTVVAGATGYTWTLPGGWTGTSTADTISATASDTSGTITVTADNSCGSSVAQTLAITVYTIPAIPVISGPATVCSGNGATYSVVDVAGATGYTWTLPASWTGAGTTDSITVSNIDTSGTISVTADNSCGSSAAQTLSVTVDTIPASPGVITGATTICSGTTNTYSVAAVAGASVYTWTLPGGWTGTSTADSISATASDTSGTITVTAGNSCGTSAAQTLSIVVNPLPVVSYAQTPSTVCADSASLLLTGESPAGGVFSGTFVSANTFDVATAGPGTYTVTYTYTDVNSCSNSATSNITVDPCIGIRENSIDAEIVLYPNPTTSTITLSGVEMQAQVILYTAIGKVVLTQVITEDKTVFDLSKEANEVYLLKIITPKGTVVKRFIKQQ